jgi:hypothetical protein
VGTDELELLHVLRAATDGASTNGRLRVVLVVEDATMPRGSNPRERATWSYISVRFCSPS